ncbi:glycosyltransferase [Mariniluteicoccus flavus]
MHVLQVSMHTSPYTALGVGDGGGMNVVVSQQAAALAALGHEVTIATRRFDTTHPDTEQVAPGITLHHLPAGPRTPLPKSRIDDHLDEFAHHLARLPRPDVIHSHHWMSGVAALPVAAAWGVPHAISFHSVAAPEGADLDAGEPPESPRRIPGERRCATECDALVAISRAEADTLAERYAAPAARVAVVPPGVDHALFRPAAAAAQQAEPADPYVLFAARLQPLKGADLVVDALALMEPVDRPRLVIAGEVSDDFADHHRDIADRVAQAGLGDHVEFVGSLPRQDFSDLMRGACALVVPSRSETFGLVALEAAACGTPVLASARGGLVEAVADGVGGFLLPREAGAWAAALRVILRDEQAYARLSRGAIEHAARFTWEATAQRLVDLYAGLRTGRTRTDERRP